ncbi:MAG: hypothetical protein V7756_09540 [Halopseudomonas sp.]|uniref:hypothetical protein n=1 Tax=Halopseudomonas sp. TaxID=2901191 RepID=UPI0030010F16
MKKEDFYTAPRANAGVKMPLKTDTGEDTGEWLLVRGVDSDAFRKARFEAARTIRDLPEDMGEWERSQAVEDAIRENIVALVADWSFDESCTPDAVREFVTQAPQVAAGIDQIAADKSLFFGNASPASKSTRKRK